MNEGSWYLRNSVTLSLSAPAAHGSPLSPASAPWLEPQTPLVITVALMRHLSSLPPTAATVLTLVSFTLNFTITNMRYTEDMGHPASLKFNFTERILQHQVKALRGPLSAPFPACPYSPSALPLTSPFPLQLQLLFNKTRVSLLYSGCRLASLR